MKRQSYMWAWIVGITLLAGACSNAGLHTGMESQAFLAYDEALRLYEARDLTTARAAFTDIVNTYPNSTVHPLSLYHIAEIEYFLGNNRKGLTYIDKFIESYHDHTLVPAALILSSHMLIDTGETDKSIAVLESVVKDYPDSKEAPVALLMLAEIAYNQGDYAGCEIILQRIIDEYPDSHQAGFAPSRIETIPQYKYHDDDRFIPDNPLMPDTIRG